VGLRAGCRKSRPPPGFDPRAVQPVVHVWGRREMHIGIGWEILKEGDRLEDLGIDGRTVLNN